MVNLLDVNRFTLTNNANVYITLRQFNLRSMHHIADSWLVQLELVIDTYSTIAEDADAAR